MTSKSFRMVWGLLLILLLAGAEIRHVGRFHVQHTQAIKLDPNYEEQLRCMADQTDAILVRYEVLAQAMTAILPFHEQAKRVTETMETMRASTRLNGKLVAERTYAMVMDPQGKVIAKRFDNLFGRALKASPRHSANLDKTTAGKRDPLSRSLRSSPCVKNEEHGASDCIRLEGGSVSHNDDYAVKKSRPSVRRHALRFPPRLLDAVSVAFFGMLGMAVRLEIAARCARLDFGVTTTMSASKTSRSQESSSASGYFLQNILGCMLMSAVARHKERVNAHLATGLSSGFCGSLTTWATWMEQEAITILNGESWMAMVSFISMICVCHMSFRVGHHLASGGLQIQQRPTIPRREKYLALRVLHVLTFVAATVIIVICLATLFLARNTTGLLDLALAPLGALLRWRLTLLNPLTEPLPVFTLLANTLACGVVACSAVGRGRAADGSLEKICWSALATGFGGSLSTVSTLVSELENEGAWGMRLRGLYLAANLASALVILLPTLDLQQ